MVKHLKYHRTPLRNLLYPVNAFLWSRDTMTKHSSHKRLMEAVTVWHLTCIDFSDNKQSFGQTKCSSFYPLALFRMQNQTRSAKVVHFKYIECISMIWSWRISSSYFYEFLANSAPKLSCSLKDINLLRVCTHLIPYDWVVFIWYFL